MAFGLDKFTRLFSRPSKDTIEPVFVEMRCVVEAIEKVSRPESDSAPKETVSSPNASVSLQEPVIFLDGRL